MTRRHVVTGNGEYTMLEGPAAGSMEDLASAFYRDIGGADFFVRLAEAFYRLVSQDDLLAPLFDGNWDSHARRLSRHYIRMYGGPDLLEAWSPRLLRVHTHAVLGLRHRERWLDLMRKAGAEINAPEPRFTGFMTTMTIASSSLSAASLGAALQRGQRIDRTGNVVDDGSPGNVVDDASPPAPAEEDE